MNRPADASDTAINRLFDGEPESEGHRLLTQLHAARRDLSVVTPDELARLEDQLTTIMGPDLQALYDWNRELVAHKSPVRFVGRDECNCPLARFLSAQVGRSIDVGDDAVSIDGFVIIGLKGPWLAFVKAFDAGFEMLEYVNVREVEYLFEHNMAAWGIRTQPPCPYCRRVNCETDPCSTELMRRAQAVTP